MSVRTFPEPETMRRGVVGVCKWGCGKPVPKPAIYWHKECFEAYALHTRLDHQKQFLLKRDGQRCAMVGCGCVPTKWLAYPGRNEAYRPDQPLYWGTPAEQEAWRAERWQWPSTSWRDMTPEQRAIGEFTAIERACALEVDHRTALWEVAHLPPDERRWYFGPENLWLLCPACHKAKTKREAADRAAQRRFAAAQPALPL